MSEPAGYNKEMVERYVMHLIELEGYERKKLKDLGEADELYFWEEKVNPDGMPEDVCGDTLFYVWNEYVDKYPDDSHLSFSWDRFYSLPEDYREKVITDWEYEYSGKDVDSSTNSPEGALAYEIFCEMEPDRIFQFLDDVMMYNWLKKHKPDGERKEK